MSACNRPPELADAQLLAVLDGDASAETRAHLADCGACRERLTVLASQERELMAALRDSGCPTPETLVDWSDARLAPAEAEAVAAHVDGCIVCRAELDDLAAFQAEALEIQRRMDRKLAAFHRERNPLQHHPAHDGGPLAGLRRVLAAAQAPGPLPVGQRARGEAGPLARSYRTDAGDIIVSCVVRPAAEPERYRLSGRVHGLGVTRLQLEDANGMPLAALALDRHGGFQVPDLPAGALRLRFDGPGLVLELDPPLEIGPVA